LLKNQQRKESKIMHIIASILFAYRRRHTADALASAPPEILIILGIIIITAIAAAIIIYTVNFFVRRHQLIKSSKAAIANYQQWYNAVRRNNFIIPAILTDLLTDPDEQVYAVSIATLIEPKSVRRSVHTGAGTHIGGIFIGRGYSTSVSDDQWRAITTGKLYLTNKRLVFDGETNDRHIKLKDITTANAAALSIDISTARRKTSLIFQTPHALIFGEAIRQLRSNPNYQQ
jgi:hypothetical protein